MRKIFITVYLFVFVAMAVWAQNGQAVRIIKTKIITGETRWSGSVLIRGDVVIAPSGHLQIAPGTRILFEPNKDVNHSGFDKTRAELIVKGTIISKGTIDRKIVFTSAAKNPRMQDWAGIVILNNTKPAVFEFSVIEYAYNGFDIKKSDPIIQNCQIQFNYNAGVKVAVRSRAKLIGNIIRDNGYAGVVCETGARPILTDNLITKNQIGIIAFGSSQPNLGDLQKGPNFNPGRNALFDNLEYDIYNHSSNDIKAEGNSWGNQDLKTILAHIYDKADAVRFGKVDFNPIKGNVDLYKKMLLAQQPAAPATKDTVENRQESNLAVANQKEQLPPKPEIVAPEETAKKNIAVAETLAKAEKTIQPEKLIAQTNEDTVQENKPLPKPTKQTISQTNVEEEQKPKIDYNQIFLDVFLDKKVKVVKEAQPIIDDPAKGMYEHGKIMVRVVVSRKGTVEQAKVLRGLNYYYDQLALDAAKKFRFEPGTVKGVPVRFSTSILFMF